MSEQIYKCPQCGKVVTELPRIKALYGDFYKDEPVYTCKCGSDFESATRCSCCGKITLDTELEENYKFCKSCTKFLQDRIKVFRDELTDDEWDYIIDYLEGVNCEI